MTPQFHEGQEVEVARATDYDDGRLAWRKANIVKLAGAADLPDCGGLNHYEVILSNGTRDIFDTDFIRPADKHPDFEDRE